MHGTYTVGGVNPDFLNLQSAVDSLLQHGIDSAVVVNIRNGQYPELLYIDSVPGCSAQNTLTFQSESGDSSTVIINGATIATQQNTLFLNNCKYLSFKRLTFFQAPNVNNNAVIKINGGKFCRFEHCIIQGHNSSNSSASDWVMQGCNDSGMVITRCGLYGAKDGLYMNNSTQNHRNLEISYCVINSGGRNVFMDGGAESHIHHNNFGSRLLYQNHRRWNFHHNRVNSTFQLIQSGGLLNSPCYFYNNIVTASGGSTAVYAFRSGSSSNIKANFNTFYVNSNTPGFAVYIEGSFSPTDLFELTDNIIYRQNNEANRYLFYYPNPTSYAPYWNFDRNIYFTNGPNMTYNYANLQAFQDSLGIEMHAVFANPQFNIPQQDYYPSNPLLNGIAQFNPLCADDLTGQSRNPYFPSNGALEMKLPPQFVNDTTLYETCVGAPFELQVPVYQGQAASNYTWVYNNVVLPDSGNTLLVNTSAPLSNENYKCIISNPWGEDTAHILLDIRPFAQVVIMNNATTICENDSLLLQAMSSADSLHWWNGQTGNSTYVQEEAWVWVQAYQQGACMDTDSLFIQQLPQPDNTVINNGTSLMAVQDSAVYQWIDCSTNQIIPGETNRLFTPSLFGNYNVNITLLSCITESDCVFFGTTSAKETGTDKESILLTKINSTSYACNKNISSALLFSTDGKSIPLATNQHVIHLIGISRGIYILQASAEGHSIRRKIIVE
ncbi:MAG: T9SS type A sorting domain-containing protein [Bacteroidota bacterium]